MAWCAEGHGASAADEKCNGAAAHALPVNKFVAMNFTVVLAPSSESLLHAFLTEEILRF